MSCHLISCSLSCSCSCSLDFISFIHVIYVMHFIHVIWFHSFHSFHFVSFHFMSFHVIHLFDLHSFIYFIFSQCDIHEMKSYLSIRIFLDIATASLRNFRSASAITEIHRNTMSQCSQYWIHESFLPEAGQCTCANAWNKRYKDCWTCNVWMQIDMATCLLWLS